jgi:hypothetical protein
MKKLLVVVLLVAVGGFAYAKWHASESRAQSKLSSLCGESVTDKDMTEMKALLGDDYDATMRCVNDSATCTEAAGCFVGGLGDRAEQIGKELDKGVRRYRDNH